MISTKLIFIYVLLFYIFYSCTYNLCNILPIFDQKPSFSHVNISEIPTPNAKKCQQADGPLAGTMICYIQ